MNPLALLFMALVTFLLGVIALAVLPALLLSLGVGMADALSNAVLASTAIGVVVFGGSFLVSLSNRPPGGPHN